MRCVIKRNRTVNMTVQIKLLSFFSVCSFNYIVSTAPVCYLVSQNQNQHWLDVFQLNIFATEVVFLLYYVIPFIVNVPLICFNNFLFKLLYHKQLFVMLQLDVGSIDNII